MTNAARILLILAPLTLCSSLACAPPAEQSAEAPAAVAVPDRLIVPGQSVGPIGPSVSRSSLVELLGPDQVVAYDVPIGEGESRPGTLVFPDSPAEVEVLWHSPRQRCPETVIVRGAGTTWSTERGVKVSAPLQMVAAENGGPFMLVGFEWDYGGTVTDWLGGELEGLALRFRLPADASDRLAASEMRGLTGDVDLRSDDPRLLQVAPEVHELGLRWDPDAPDTKACLNGP